MAPCFPGLFKEFKDFVPISDFWEYGYCDTEESLKKYLKSYIEDPSENFMVFVGLMYMNYEKYYKNGSYINKDGIDTGDDYFDYIEEHPDMEIEQDYPEQWITFSIRKIAREV